MIERSLCFGKGQKLVGTICLPTVPGIPEAAIGLVMFNAGVVHRIGPHRINVRLARLLAANGIPTIRFDLAGQGDSARADGLQSFEAQAIDDIRSAMDVLGNAANVSRFALFGFCSGSVHSYATAQADERVCGLLLYDMYIYPTVRSRLNRYANAVREKGFARTLRGWIPQQLSKLTAAISVSMGSGTRRASPRKYGMFTQPSKSVLADAFARLHARGTSICVAYSGSFRDYNYREQFNDAFRQFGIDQFVSSEYFENVDHTITLIGEQAAYMDFVLRWCAKINDERQDQWPSDCVA